MLVDRFRHATWVTLAMCACAPRSQSNLAMPGAVASVDVETARVRALGAFEPRCARGSLECDGAMASSPSSKHAVPAGAAGFDFSMTDGDAEKRCRNAGQMWSTQSRDAFVCSGSAGERLPYHVDIFTCGGHVCRLVLSRSAGTIDEVERDLETEYGPPSFRDARHAAWRWDNGYTLTLALEAPNGGTFVFLSYSSPTFGETVRTRGL
jgi:hypothetical protein